MSGDATPAPSALDRPICLTTFDDVAAIYKHTELVSLRALIPRLRDTRAPDKASLPLAWISTEPSPPNGGRVKRF